MQALDKRRETYYISLRIGHNLLREAAMTIPGPRFRTRPIVIQH